MIKYNHALTSPITETETRELIHEDAIAANSSYGFAHRMRLFHEATSQTTTAELKGKIEKSSPEAKLSNELWDQYYDITRQARLTVITWVTLLRLVSFFGFGLGACAIATIVLFDRMHGLKEGNLNYSPTAAFGVVAVIAIIAAVVHVSLSAFEKWLKPLSRLTIEAFPTETGMLLQMHENASQYAEVLESEAWLVFWFWEAIHNVYSTMMFWRKEEVLEENPNPMLIFATSEKFERFLLDYTSKNSPNRYVWVDNVRQLAPARKNFGHMQYLRGKE